MPSILCRDRINVVLSGEMWKPELFQHWVFTVIFLVKLLIMTFDLRISNTDSPIKYCLKLWADIAKRTSSKIELYLYSFLQ